MERPKLNRKYFTKTEHIECLEDYILQLEKHITELETIEPVNGAKEMAKIHYRDGSVIDSAPPHEKEKWRKRFEWGALCGHVRKNTTYDKDSVTCFYCRKALERGEDLK